MLKHIYDDNGYHYLFDDTDGIEPEYHTVFGYIEPAYLVTYDENEQPAANYVAFTRYHFPSKEFLQISGSSYVGPLADVIYQLQEVR